MFDVGLTQVNKEIATLKAIIKEAEEKCDGKLESYQLLNELRKKLEELRAKQ